MSLSAAGVDRLGTAVKRKHHATDSITSNRSREHRLNDISRAAGRPYAGPANGRLLGRRHYASLTDPPGHSPNSSFCV